MEGMGGNGPSTDQGMLTRVRQMALNALPPQRQFSNNTAAAASSSSSSSSQQQHQQQQHGPSILGPYYAG